MQGQEEKTPLPVPEIENLIRSLVSAIRAVKLYPPNNPVYSQSVRKSHDLLAEFLGSAPELRLGVQKTFFSHKHLTFGKETQLNKAIAQDLYAKGLRELIFSSGTTETEFLELLQALALPLEESAMRSGISSILWQKGVTHIKVTDSGLDEVITTKTDAMNENKAASEKSGGRFDAGAGEQVFKGSQSVVLTDLMADPAAFAAGLVQLAEQTHAEGEDVDERLHSLYLETGRKIRDEDPDNRDALYRGLADSALSLEPPYRDGLIAGKLYKDVDSEFVIEQNPELDDQLPNKIQEILTGRYSDSWTPKQVAVLLKKASEKQAPPPMPARILEAEPIPLDLVETVNSFADYTPDEMKTLKAISEAGMESDIIEAATRTLLFLLPLVKSSQQTGPDEKEVRLFSSVVKQLEDTASYLLQKKDYDFAVLIIRSLHMPVDPAFRPRMAEAVKKAASRSSIAGAIRDLKNFAGDSVGYRSVHSYLALLPRESTETLLGLLAEEKNRTERAFLLDLLKDIGRDQLSFIGEHVSDERWYVVRNIVTILGESKADQAVAFLSKAADHKNVQIRQEVIKGLVTIGGKKAALLLARFLYDRDEEVRLQAIRAIPEIRGAGTEEIQALTIFLEGLSINMRTRAVIIEALKTLGRIGNSAAAESLLRYEIIRWWKPRKLQKEIRSAASRARDEIMRREIGG